MSIDISQLSQKKQAFLKANLELLKSLEQVIPRQISGMQKHQDKIAKSKSKWQRGFDEALAKADESRRERNPNLQEIQDKFLRKLNVVKGEGKLVCPKCGDSDKGNKMNGKPFCFKCKAPLVLRRKIK